LALRFGNTSTRNCSTGKVLPITNARKLEFFGVGRFRNWKKKLAVELR
jgi:hypothetical protein